MRLDVFVWCRWWWRRLWFPAVIVFGAVWIDLSSFHAAIVPDSLIPILSSLYAWEPFFWEQTRIGMLVPLLAAPVSNPWNNLLLQTWFSIVSGLTLLVLLVRYVYDGHGWRQIALASIAAFLLAAPQSTQYILLSTQVTYGAALSLGLAALLILRSSSWSRKRSTAVALLLSIIAHWLNGAAALLLMPLVITLGVFDRRGGREHLGKVRPLNPEAVAGSLILMVGFGAGQLMAWASPYPLWHLRVLDPVEWPEAWTRMAASTWAEVSGPWGLILAAGAVGLAVGVREYRHGRPARALYPALAFCTTAFAYWLLLGGSEWVMLNHYHHRYGMPAVLCLHTAAMILILIPLIRLKPRPSPILGTFVSLSILLVSILSNYGLPSASRARATLDERLGELSEDVRVGRVTHVLGSYGTVWTTVFHSNLLRYEEGRPGVIWGIAHRAGPTAKYWRNVPLAQWRIGVKSGDRQW